MELTEEWEEPGLWWEPEHPDERFTGVLRYSPSLGARLELIREEEPGPESLSETTSLPVLRGVTVGGKEMTLLDCFEVNRSFTFPIGLRKSTIRAGLVLSGVGLDRQEEAIFKSLSGRFTNLESWLCT